mmetsp:Transcript_11037/g.32341  ORF Transcript_11037/g.32341 Transcript_11037/m.32341 type:complete len:167 (-) Transcript_11037:20-520(-)
MRGLASVSRVAAVLVVALAQCWAADAGANAGAGTSSDTKCNSMLQVKTSEAKAVAVAEAEPPAAPTEDCDEDCQKEHAHNKAFIGLLEPGRPKMKFKARDFPGPLTWFLCILGIALVSGVCYLMGVCSPHSHDEDGPEHKDVDAYTPPTSPRGQRAHSSLREDAAG